MKIYVSPTNQTGNTYNGINTNEGYQMNRVAIAMHAELQSYVVDLKLGDYTKRMWETNAAGALIGGRIYEAKQWGADYYFEIHSDATGVHNYGVGASCYYRPNATIKTKLANTFVSELNRICPYPKNRGGAIDGYAKGYLAIRHSENAGMAGFLIETNFHDNPNVAKWIVDNVTLIGKTLAIAAAKELGLKKKVDPTPTPTPTPTPVPPEGRLVTLTKGTVIHREVPSIVEVTTKYTIVEEKNGYGKLKSGAGWVKLPDA